MMTPKSGHAILYSFTNESNASCLDPVQIPLLFLLFPLKMAGCKCRPCQL